MVSVNPNPAPGFYFFDPMNNMGLPGVNSVPPVNTVPPPLTPPPPPPSNSGAGNTTGFLEDASKKIRKPYTITKSRESWTEQEHEKFLEALQLFDRDWKKIEAFVGSKTVIQIRSHAQKYFLKVQKNGTSEHVPPPRPKRKAAHPYPQKAPKNASVAPQVVTPQVAGPFQPSSALHESGYTYGRDSSAAHANSTAAAPLSSWSYNSVPPVTVSQVTKDDAVVAGPTVAHNSCYSSSCESTPRTWSFGETIDRGDHWKQSRVLPDFSQVYSFIGSVFDPGVSGHLQKLKQMDPINLETVLLLMKNLSVNLMSPEFEDHRRLLSTYDPESEAVKRATKYNSVRSAVQTA